MVDRTLTKREVELLIVAVRKRGGSYEQVDNLLDTWLVIDGAES